MKTETAYDYVDENGILLYQNVRVEVPGREKTFHFRRSDGKGGWEYGLDGVRKVPYRLPRFIAAIAKGERIFGCEGEKDVATLEAFGLTATSTNNLHAHRALFADARFVLLYDSDKAGRRIRDELAAALAPICAEFRVVHLAPDDRDDGFDVTDWVAAGGTKEDLLRLLDVDGVALLNDVVAFLTRFVRVSPRATDAQAAYAAHTHLAPWLDIVAYVHYYSAGKGCGKTVAMDVMYWLCADSLRAGDASVAYIARALSKPRTVFIDELDAVFKGDKERAQLMRGVLNQGYRKSGTYGRCDPPKFESVEHPVFGPKLFAGIGRDSLPDTLRHRSIPIYMERISPDDEVEPDFERHVKLDGERLGTRLGGWVRSNAPAVVARIDALYAYRREESVLARLDKRAFEIWAPLVAICDVAGGEWPIRIRKAAAELMLGEDGEDRSYLERALANIYEVFETDGGDSISSAELVEKLKKNPEWEWAEWNRGKGITQRGLADLLRDFRIRPKSIREGDDTFKGYKRECLAKVWRVYRIPSPPTSDPSQPSQPKNHAALSHIFDPSQNPGVTDVESGSNPDEMDIVTDVTDKTPDSADGGGRHIGEAATPPRDSLERTQGEQCRLFYGQLSETPTCRRCGATWETHCAALTGEVPHPRFQPPWPGYPGDYSPRPC